MVLISKLEFDNVFDFIDKQIKRDKEVHAVNTTFLSEYRKYRKNDIRKVFRQLGNNVRFNDIDTSLDTHIESGYFVKITTEKGHPYYERPNKNNLESSQMQFYPNAINNLINDLHSNIENLTGKQIFTKQGKLRVKNKDDYELMIQSLQTLSKYYTQLLHFRETIIDKKSHKPITELIEKTKNALRRYDKKIINTKEKRSIFSEIQL
jgi:hypothetical protein